MQNETKRRKNQKVNKNENNEIEVKPYPWKKKPNIQQPKINLAKCPSRKKIFGLNSINVTVAKIVIFFINKPKHLIN